MAVGGAIVAAVGLVANEANNSKVRQQTRKRTRAEERATAAQNAAETRRAIAAGRRARAQTLQQGENQGVGGGSSTQGAAQNAMGQAASGIGFSNQLQALDRQRYRAQEGVNKWSMRGNTIAGATDAGQSIAGIFRK